MLYRHVFDKISTEFGGIFRVFVNFAGFHRFTGISRLHDRAKYQKPWQQPQKSHEQDILPKNL